MSTSSPTGSCRPRVVVQDTPGGRPRVTRWLVNPGVPVPAGATEVHGLTDEHLQRNGRWPAPVMEEIARGAGRAVRGGPPAGGDERAVRSDDPGPGAAPPSRLVAGPLVRRTRRCCVLDPRVLDKHLDRYRKGRRTLTDLCAHYDVALEGAHDAAADALAAMDVVRAVGRRFAARLERLSPGRTAHAAGGVARGAGAGPAGVVRAQRHAGGGGPGVAAASGSAGGGREGQQQGQQVEQRVGATKSRSVWDGPAFPGGRYWVRTSDLFGVNEALSH